MERYNLDSERDELILVLEQLAATHPTEWSTSECSGIDDDKIRQAMESMVVSVRSASLFEMSNLYEMPIQSGSLMCDVHIPATLASSTYDNQNDNDADDSLLRECPSESSSFLGSPKRFNTCPAVTTDFFEEDDPNDSKLLSFSTLDRDRCLSPMVMSPREIKIKRGTVLSIVVAEPPAIGSPSESHFRTSVAAIQCIARKVKNFHGTIFQTSHNEVTCSWNTHKPDVQHALHAVQCGLACANELRKVGGRGWVIAASSGELVVGQTNKSPCAVGDAMLQLPHLSSLGSFINCHFVAAESVIDIVDSVIESRPVDVVHADMPRHCGPTIVVHEVLGEKDNKTLENQPNTQLFASAFRDIRLHKFKEAAQTLDQIDSDRQVKRLRKIATSGIRRAPIPNPYVRRLDNWEEFKYGSTNQLLPDSSCKSFSISMTMRYLDAPVNHNESDALGLREAIKGAADDLLSSSSTYTSDEEEEFATNFIDTHGDPWRIADKILGCGALGAVKLGLGSNGCLVALKTLKLNTRPGSPHKQTQQQLEVESIINEVTILSQQRHDNIVSYIGSGVVTGSVVICMEYVPGGSLQSLIEQFGQLPHTALRRYVKDIMKGLKFLHGRNITHYDIKPGNVLLHTDGQCKIADFGTAKLGKTEAGKIVGTPIYMSPEACRGEAEKPTDIWGLGILACQCATGKIPFSLTGDFSPFLFCRRMSKGEVDIELPSIEAMGGHDAHDFAAQCLKEVASDRPEVGILGMHPYVGK